MWWRKKPGGWWMKECPLAYASQAGFVLHYKHQQQSSRGSHLAWHAEQRYSNFFVSFYFKLQFTTFQKKVSDTCMFTQNRASESNMVFNCNSTYSAFKLIEEMFYQPLKTRVKMVLLFSVYWTEDYRRLSYLYWNESCVLGKILKE